jgi:hypothetical protein
MSDFGPISDELLNCLSQDDLVGLAVTLLAQAEAKTAESEVLTRWARTAAELARFKGLDS